MAHSKWLLIVIVSLTMVTSDGIVWWITLRVVFLSSAQKLLFVLVHEGCQYICKSSKRYEVFIFCEVGFNLQNEHKINSAIHHSHRLDTEQDKSKLKKPIHVLWQGQMTWRLPKSTQASRWKTVWESRQEWKEGVCGEGQTQCNRNRVKEKVIKRDIERKLRKSVLVHNDSVPLVFCYTVREKLKISPTEFSECLK